MKNVIYKLSYKDSDKSYIGLTKDFEKRMNNHKYLAMQENPHQHIHKAIKKFLKKTLKT